METKCIKLVPPCYTMSGEWYDVEKHCHVPAPVKPVYVRINGRKRQAKRWLWLWRIVAWCQRHFITRQYRLWLLQDLPKHKIDPLPPHVHAVDIPRRAEQ